MQAFPSIEELLMNPVAAAAVVVVAVNAISYALGVKPNWLSIVVALAYMVGGYLVTGRTTPDQLFLAVIYALLVVAPLAHVDGATLAKLFASNKTEMRTIGENDRKFFQNWL